MTTRCACPCQAAGRHLHLTQVQVSIDPATQQRPVNRAGMCAPALPAPFDETPLCSRGTSFPGVLACGRRRVPRSVLVGALPQSHADGLLKQVRMSPRAFEDDLVTLQLVDQQPIRLKMALTPAAIIAFQGVIVVALRQRLLVDQRRHDHLELLDIFPAPLRQPQITLELAGIAGACALDPQPGKHILRVVTADDVLTSIRLGKGALRD
jgi:hypothetical protein